MIDLIMQESNEPISRKVGKRLLSLSLVKGGGNNQNFKAIFESNEVFALKYYPDNEHGKTRLEKEFNAMKLLGNYSQAPVPQAYHTDGNRWALYEWVEGERILSVTYSDLDQLMAFITRLNKLSRSIQNQESILPATDPCFSAESLIAQIEKRLLRFQLVLSENCLLNDFFMSSFLPVFKQMTKRLKIIYTESHLNFSQEIQHDQRILSPSDFGFHNAIRRTDGQIIFIDFEYFGWDDPVAMISDFLWHPGMNLTEELKQYFLTQVMAVFSQDVNFTFRLTALFPFFGLTWALIILNEFIPEVWRRRVISGSVNEKDKEIVQQKQLEKAKQFLQRAQSAQEVFPYAI